MASLSPVKFLKEVKQELRQVTWPTKQEVIRLTSMVVVISLIVGIYIGALDFIFTKLVEFAVKR